MFQLKRMNITLRSFEEKVTSAEERFGEKNVSESLALL